MEAALFDKLAKMVADVPGDVAEVGVHKGDSAEYLTTLFPTRQLHLYDTFTGLPGQLKLSIDHNRGGAFACSRHLVEERLSGTNAICRPGIFPEQAINEPLCFVHCDVDYYYSTLAVLCWGWQCLSPGGVIVCDDYGFSTCLGAGLAVKHWLPEGAELHLAVKRCWVRKEPTGDSNSTGGGPNPP